MENEMFGMSRVETFLSASLCVLTLGVTFVYRDDILAMFVNPMAYFF